MNATTDEALAMIHSAAKLIQDNSNSVSSAYEYAGHEIENGTDAESEYGARLQDCSYFGKQINEAALDILAALNALGVK